MAESWITKMQAENEAMRYLLAELIGEIPNLGASRLAKLTEFPAGPDYADRDLGYKTCAEEVSLRARELADRAFSTALQAGINIPSAEAVRERQLGPVTYERRAGNTGEPNYETIYESVPSRWNDLAVGDAVTHRLLQGQPGKVLRKSRASGEERAAITVQWGPSWQEPVTYHPGEQSLEEDIEKAKAKRK